MLIRVLIVFYCKLFWLWWLSWWSSIGGWYWWWCHGLGHGCRWWQVEEEVAETELVGGNGDVWCWFHGFGDIFSDRCWMKLKMVFQGIYGYKMVELSWDWICRCFGEFRSARNFNVTPRWEWHIRCSIKVLNGFFFTSSSSVSTSWACVQGGLCLVNVTGAAGSCCRLLRWSKRKWLRWLVMNCRGTEVLLQSSMGIWWLIWMLGQVTWQCWCWRVLLVDVAGAVNPRTRRNRWWITDGYDVVELDMARLQARWVTDVLVMKLNWHWKWYEEVYVYEMKWCSWYCCRCSLVVVLMCSQAEIAGNEERRLSWPWSWWSWVCQITGWWME